jgi:Amt family ammonium transporter
MKSTIMKQVVLAVLFVAMTAFLSPPLIMAEEAAAPATAPTVAAAMPAAASPAPKIDTGDTAWMTVATAFVMLMSIPGLALF